MEIAIIVGFGSIEQNLKSCHHVNSFPKLKCLQATSSLPRFFNYLFKLFYIHLYDIFLFNKNEKKFSFICFMQSNLL